MISMGKTLETLEKIQTNLENALSLYNTLGAEFYEEDISKIESMLSDINDQLQEY